MWRTWRTEFREVLYLVLSRGNEQAGRFLHDDDWSDFIGLRDEILNHFNVDVLACVTLIKPKETLRYIFCGKWVALPNERLGSCLVYHIRL